MLNVHTGFPNLASSLGEAGADMLNLKIRADYQPSTKRVRMLHNPHQQYFEGIRSLRSHREVEDILVGICQLDWGSNGGTLTPSRLLAILASTQSISSELLAEAMAISDRQARRYLAASKLAINKVTKLLSPVELTSRSPTLAELRARLKSQQE